MKLGRMEALYETKGGVLGSDEFVDSMIHRVGEFVRRRTPEPRTHLPLEFSAEALLAAVESVFGIPN